MFENTKCEDCPNDDDSGFCLRYGLEPTSAARFPAPYYRPGDEYTIVRKQI